MICKEFQKLRYFKGVIQLALEFAKTVDPLDDAITWKKSASPDNDARRELYEKRMQAYNCIADTFNILFWSTTASLTPQEMEKIRTDKKIAVQLSINSQDELFHYFIYEWYLEKGLGTELLHINSPFLENFLKDSNEYQLLSNYYIRHGKMVPAALILIKFAEIKDPNTTLLQRIEFLGTANNYLNDESVAADRELAQQLQEKIDVRFLLF